MGNILQQNLVHIGKGMVVLIISIWVLYHFCFKSYYQEKYENLDNAEIAINSLKFAMYGAAVYLSYRIYNNMSMVNNVVEALSSIAYILTAMECTTYGLNSFGILIFKLINDK